MAAGRTKETNDDDRQQIGRHAEMKKIIMATGNKDGGWQNRRK